MAPHPVLRREVVWLLGSDEPALDAARAAVFRAGVEAGVAAEPRAFPWSRPVPGRLPRGERPAAVVAVADRAALAEAGAAAWLRWCVSRVARRDDFRVFVRLEGVGPADLSGGAGTDPAWGALRDTVQFADPSGAAASGGDLAAFLRRLPRTRTESRWRAWATPAAVALGRAATVCQAAALVVVALLVLLLPVFGLRGLADAAAADPRLPVLIGLACAALWFPLVSVPVFLLARGPRVVPHTLRRNRRLRLLLGGCSVLLPAAVAVPDRVGTPAAWLGVGAVGGFVFDVTRRRGLQARRMFLALRPRVADPGRRAELPRELAEVAGGRPADPLACPLAASLVPSVMISYSRTSAWCAETAASLAALLDRAGARVFIDRQGIEEGANWRRSLMRGVAEANVVVCLADADSVGKPWVAAEVEAALRGRRLTGGPHVVVLVGPDLGPADGPGPRQPVFEAILSRADPIPREDEPRLIRVKPGTTLRVVASDLGPRRFQSPACVPGIVGGLLAQALRLPFLVVGGMFPPAGVILGLVVLLSWLGVVSDDTLAPAVADPDRAYALASVAWAFAVRTLIADHFELPAPFGVGVRAYFLGSVVGFGVFLTAWVGRVTAAGVGWAVVLGVLSWGAAAAFAEWMRVTQDRP